MGFRHFLFFRSKTWVSQSSFYENFSGVSRISVIYECGTSSPFFWFFFPTLKREIRIWREKGGQFANEN